jgi:hypothetical protein
MKGRITEHGSGRLPSFRLVANERIGNCRYPNGPAVIVGEELLVSSHQILEVLQEMLLNESVIVP